MKNNIVFKFIAVILCAASLLGAVGGIAGVVVLTSGDLYNQTVAELEEERTMAFAEGYAEALARQYAGTELGGCPEEMVNDIQGIGNGFQSVYSAYGYRILDADGNVVSTYNEDQKGAAFSFPVTGQYMHLVSSESQSEIEAREVQEQIVTYSSDVGDGSSEVPAEGILIDHVMFLDTDGALIYEAEGRRSGDSESTYYYDGIRSEGHNGDYTGYLFYNRNGELVYNSFFEDYYVNFPETEVAEYFFMNSDEGFVLSNNDPDGLGVIVNDTGNLRFVSYFILTDTTAANQPMLAEEPIPEETSGWSVETIPGSDNTVTVIAPDGTSMEVVFPSQAEATVATEAVETVEPTAAVSVPDPTEVTYEVTIPVETTEETIPSSASAVPETTPTAAPELTEVTEATEATEMTVPVAVTAPTEVPETIPAETAPPETVPAETVPEVTEPVLINGKTLDNYQINSGEYFDSETQEWMTAKYVYVPMPELTVEVYVDPDSANDSAMYDLLDIVRQYRNYLLPAIAICLFLFAVFAVYLCTAAGRKPKTDEVRAGGLNRLPLDLYLVGGGFAIALCIAFGAEGFLYLLGQNLLVGCATAVGLFFLACLLFVAFCFAFVAQIKTPGGFWWRNTLCGRFLFLFIRFGRWLETFLSTKGFPALGRAIKGLWRFTVKSVVWLYHGFENSIVWIGKKVEILLRWIGRKIHRFLSLLPLTWQWLIGGLLLIFIAAVFINDAVSPNVGFVAFLFCLAVVLYAAHCFGILSESTKKMAKGDLDTKVEDKLLFGCFDEFASDLNDLADVAVVAAQKQLKSERMKTELITNVSHDIKTPLTSIINYVDLLQKPHTDAEQEQYLEVLDRQSQRLKKLIDDLMEMSKANTGNMQVDITQVDAVESVNQALGEFSDKLTKAQLMPVFRHDDAQVPMMADGRLVWRVLSNLLSNAVKYAMPGTRLYIDLMTLEGKVVISLKNISREELNIDADELMERFVRGDDSRNTEGSGLGLNIAKSLMELQKGQLQLLVDGDLFKVTLIFPGI